MASNGISEEIKARLDIVEIVSEYVDLKKAGSNYRGLCPFHSEKTPSFMVSPQKQIFHCFGCGAGGDVFGFIMRYDNFSFPEAVEALAKRAGIEIRSAPVRKTASGDEILYKIHEDAVEYFSMQLGNSAEAAAYFTRRGLDRSVTGKFRLGFAPPKPDNLYRHLRTKGFQDSALASSGLVKFADGKRPYDMFRNRIIFPIVDPNGRCIAFGGRVFDSSDSGPKYLNSPETSIFKKGNTLYGLDIARDLIRKKGYALITEGYMDVIACHQFGIENAVAPLGTALTEGHLKKLRGYAKKLLLVFDGDQAGRKAARRSLPIVYENGLRAKVLLLPGELDPDTFLREKGVKEFRQLFPVSRGIVDFYLELQEDRVEIIRELMELTSKIGDAILRGQIIAEISQKTSIPAEYLVEETRKTIKPERREPRGKAVGQVPLAEETLLAVLFLKPEFGPEIFSRLDENDFEKPVARSVFLKGKQAGEFPHLNGISSVFDNEEVSYITYLTFNAGFDEDAVRTIIDDCFKKIRSRKFKRSIEEMELRIKIAESSGDRSVLDSLLSRKQSILREARNEGIL